MCGIIAYIGDKEALPILMHGLRRLEYRGYDSAGVALHNGEEIFRIREVGNIDALHNKLRGNDCSAFLGIAHTRWATHGGVTELNAHPHLDCSGNIVLVHNGIIENYRELKEMLGDTHLFVSQTDSEILVHLIEYYYTGDLRNAIELALDKVRGTYGLACFHKAHPTELIVARMGSPLVIGVSPNNYYVASDTTPLLAYTNKMIFLDDGELAQIVNNELQIYTLDKKLVVKSAFEIDWKEEEAQRGGYDTFMLKEINDQPSVFLDAIRGRYNQEDGTAHLGGINMTTKEMHSIKRVLFVACGTAYHAGMVAKYWFEQLVHIPTEVEVASEFRYRDPVINKETLVFVISQSGETADTLAALREAKRKGAYVRGIVNVVGSTVSRETDGGTYIHAGPELSVASTKAFTNMLAVLFLYALQFGRLRYLSISEGKLLLNELISLPEKMTNIIQRVDELKKIADKYKMYDNFLFLGRGLNYPVSLEGSLKLKELSYIHSEALPAGEMKHGTNALLSEDFPVLGILTKNNLYEKMRSNIEEVRARGAKIVLIVNTGDISAQYLANETFSVPQTHNLLEPILNIIPLQLLAYNFALLLGRDVDRPRNLAKSVTVE